MLPVSERLDLYRAEKAALDFPSDPFMSFSDWDKDYQAEYRKTHVAVDVKTAMREADALVEEAEAELFNEDEEMQMTETNLTSGVVGSAPVAVDPEVQAELDNERRAAELERKTTAAVENPRKAKPKAKAKAAPKKASKPKAKAKAAKPRVARKDNKTAAAQAIFDRMYGKKPRKDVIAAFVEKVGLTPNGASTYYQKLKAAA